MDAKRMIRPLVESDRAATITLLRRAPAQNLYLLGNIAALGMVNAISHFWGDFAGQAGELRGAVNLYMTGWSIFGLSHADWSGLAAVIDRHPTAADRLQDNPGGVPSIVPYLQMYETVRASEEELMQLAGPDFVAADPPESCQVRRATWADFDALAAFYADAESMTRVAAAVERPLRDRRIWVAQCKRTITSAALTNAETADHAMIGGVYTRPDARNQGLSRAVCSALCAELLGEGRQPFLYWDNPAAGAVYRRLGFRPIGIWRSLRIRRRAQALGRR